jgi:hypothetical protein
MIVLVRLGERAKNCIKLLLGRRFIGILQQLLHEIVLLRLWYDLVTHGLRLRHDHGVVHWLCLGYECFAVHGLCVLDVVVVYYSLREAHVFIRTSFDVGIRHSCRVGDLSWGRQLRLGQIAASVGYAAWVLVGRETATSL